MAKPNKKIPAREFCDVLLANKNVTSKEILMILRKKYPHLELTAQSVNNYLSSLKFSSLADIVHDKITRKYTLRSVNDAYFRYSAHRNGVKERQKNQTPRLKPRSLMDEHDVAICRLVSMFDRCIRPVRTSGAMDV